MDVFEALADPIRRDLLRRLSAGPTRVVDLAAEHPISRPAISRHLRLLGEAGLVTADERGRERHYTIEPGPLAEVDELLGELRPRAARRPPIAAEQLNALETEVRRTARDRRAAQAATEAASPVQQEDIA